VREEIFKKTTDQAWRNAASDTHQVLVRHSRKIHVSKLAAFLGARQLQPEVTNVLLANLQLRALLVKFVRRTRQLRAHILRANLRRLSKAQRL
jgi:hypothetical protein